MMIAVFVFGMMIALFGALVPIAGQGGRSGSSYAQASLLAQHKIDQVRQGGFNKLTGSQMVSMGIIDANADGTPMTVTAPAGLPAGTTSYSFTGWTTWWTTARTQGFFPAGSQGILSLSPALSGQGGNAPTAAQALQVTVTLTWPSNVRAAAGTNDSTYSAHTIIANY